MDYIKEITDLRCKVTDLECKIIELKGLANVLDFWTLDEIEKADNRIFLAASAEFPKEQVEEFLYVLKVVAKWKQPTSEEGDNNG